MQSKDSLKHNAMNDFVRFKVVYFVRPIFRGLPSGLPNPCPSRARCACMCVKHYPAPTNVSEVIFFCREQRENVVSFSPNRLTAFSKESIPPEVTFFSILFKRQVGPFGGVKIWKFAGCQKDKLILQK